MPLDSIDCLAPELDRVIVLPEIRKETVVPDGKIIRPDSAKDEDQVIVCKVVAVGPGKEEMGFKSPMRFSADQVVVIGAYAGTEIPYMVRKPDGSSARMVCRVIEQDQILCKWDPTLDWPRVPAKRERKEK